MGVQIIPASGGGGGGTGDVVGPASAVDSQVALFSGVTGKLIKASTGTGISKLTSGVQSTITPGTGVETWLATPSSANLAAAVTDETGSGSLVFATSPTLVTPALGTPASGVATNITGLVATNLASGTVPTARLGSGTADSTTFLRGDQTYAVPPAGGSGDVVGPASSVDSQVALFNGVTGKLLKAASGTGLVKITAGVQSAITAGAGVETWLATPSSANLATAVTDETGSGALVFATSPTLVTPAIGTPSSGVATNITGLVATNLASGTVPTARLGSGTADNTTFLRGDQTYAVPASGAAVANPGAQVLGLTAINGVAVTALRSDGAPALDVSIAPTWTGIHAFTPAARASGVLPYFKLTIPTDTGVTAATSAPGFQLATGTRTWATTGTVAVQAEVDWVGPTYASASASQTFTDVFLLRLQPPTQGTNAIFTRAHTFGIVDSTAASSSITGGFIVATTLGTAATSVGVGGGNIYAGGLIQVTSALSNTVPGLQIGTAGFGLGRDTNNGMAVFFNGAHLGSFNTYSFNTRSDYLIKWASGTSITGNAPDTGLGRNAAGVVEVNNGTASTYRDLRLSHLLAGGTAPTVAAGTGAGTTPTVTMVTGSQDLAGQLSVVTGTTPTAAATVATITLNRAFPTGCWVSLTPANAATAALAVGAVVFVPAGGTTTWVVTAGGTALPASTALLWNYHCLGF